MSLPPIALAGVAALLFVSIGGQQAPPAAPAGVVPPDQSLPPHIRKLTGFGERAEFSLDSKRVLFLSKTFGDALEIDLGTGVIRNLTAHFPHHGFTRALYLANGHILLSGPTEFSPANVGAARTNCWLFVLDPAGTARPQPLGVKAAEGPVPSRTRYGPSVVEGRLAFIKYSGRLSIDAVGPWKAFVMEQVSRAVVDGDLTTFVSGLQREPWLLGEESVGFQAELIGAATLNGRGEFITALLDLDPAILRRQPPPPSQAIEFAVTYANTHLFLCSPASGSCPMICRMRQPWATSAREALVRRVRRPCAGRSRPPLSLQRPARARPPPVGSAHGAAGARHGARLSVINRHFDVADFLLAHGADINTNWNSHEPASILHHLVFYGSYESMQFLIDRGIDMTIKDYRWNSTARGWALYGKKDEKMAQWLEEAERQRELKR